MERTYQFIIHLSNLILRIADSHRTPVKPLGHAQVPRIALQIPSFKHPVAQYETKIFRLSLKFGYSLIYLLMPAVGLETHRSDIPPSGQMHPKVESIIIQTPSFPQNECSQTATKRRATKKIQTYHLKNEESLKPCVLIDVILLSGSTSRHVEFVNVPSEHAQISGRLGIFVCKHRLALFPQSNEHSEYQINLYHFSPSIDYIPP